MTGPVFSCSFLMLLLSGFLLAPEAAAQWSTDAGINLPICTASGPQIAPSVIADGAGGILVAWSDGREFGGQYVFATHVLGNGTFDPNWPAGGRRLTTLSPGFRSEFLSGIVSDGAGGAVATWYDQTSTSFGIYAQHAQADGLVDPSWPAAGLPVAGGPTSIYFPRCASDGAGGVIVTWQSGPGGQADVLAQHVLAGGMLDPAWPPAGLIVGGTNNGQENPEIVEDGAGGAIIVWLDGRTGGVNPYDVYGQHVLASGVADPAWPTNGIALCSAAGNQSAPRVVSNGAGGAIVCWQDPRDGMHSKLYAQRVSALGTIDSPWPPDGLAVCAAPGHQVAPAQVPDGAGGAVVVWVDLRGDTSAVYAARVLAAGTLDPAWPATGRLLCTAPNVEFTGAVVDGAGGAVAVWRDYRNDDGSFANGDLFAQRVLSSGIVDPAWPLSATPLCIAPDQQLDVAAAPSGAGGVITVWQDQRLGISFPDLYGQRVNGDGQLGDDAPVSVAPAVGSGFASLRISPSPARGLLHIDFTLARAGGTRLELLDVSGRRLMVRDFGWLDRGRHLIDLQTSLAPGVYVVRTGTGSETHEARAVLIR